MIGLLNVENTKWINFQPYTFENELTSKPVRKKNLIFESMVSIQWKRAIKYIVISDEIKKRLKLILPSEN